MLGKLGSARLGLARLGSKYTHMRQAEAEGGVCHLLNTIAALDDAMKIVSLRAGSILFSYLFSRRY